jgi:hypothetical protein
MIYLLVPELEYTHSFSLFPVRLGLRVTNTECVTAVHVGTLGFQ